MSITRKILPFEVKSVDEAEGTFKGIASTTGNIDSQGDVIVRGAYTKTLKENKDNVLLFYDHNHKEGGLPIGVPQVLKMEGDQLHIEGKISKTTTGKDIITLMKDGVLKNLSVGFHTVKEKWAEGVRYIQELKLMEVSIVPWGANENAKILAVKGSATKYLDFDTAFQQRDLYSAPYRLHDSFLQAMESILTDMAVVEEERYSALKDSLSQFSDKFSTWIEDAFVAGIFKAAKAPLELKDNSEAAPLASTEPTTVTQDDAQAGNDIDTARIDTARIDALATEARNRINNILRRLT